jgi:CBS domain containing-hemolysin-like protein
LRTLSANRYQGQQVKVRASVKTDGRESQAYLSLFSLRLGQSLSFEDIAAPPMMLHADVPISEAVDRFQAQHQELALVYDDPGETVVGLITATDALEAVMGEIEDPIDVDDTPPTTRVSQSTALTESHPTATGRLDVCPATTARRLS